MRDMYPRRQLLFRLPDTFTVCNSNAFATLQTLSYIERSMYNKYIIFSDSKSVVTALKKLESHNTIIQSIMKINSKLARTNRSLVLLDPSTCRRQINKDADSTAKLVSSAAFSIKIL